MHQGKKKDSLKTLKSTFLDQNIRSNISSLYWVLKKELRLTGHRV